MSQRLTDYEGNEMKGLAMEMRDSGKGKAVKWGRLPAGARD